MTTITIKVSGELFFELRDTTMLGDNWGYGATTDVDLEVQAMVRSATLKAQGTGMRVTMTGSADAWKAITEFIDDRAYMERNGAGDFDRGKGTRLYRQTEKIRAAL